MKKVMLISSLFSILVSSCITVPRIQKKDARNNQFSQELQTWFYVAHPQKIDTGIQNISDTTYDTLYTAKVFTKDSISKDSFYIDSNNQIVYGLIDTSITFANAFITSLPTGFEVNGNGFLQLKSDTVYIRRTIHDSVIINKVNTSEINALKTQLQTSRDSINNLTLQYANEKTTAAKRLIWVISLSVLLALSGFFNFKNLLKL